MASLYIEEIRVSMEDGTRSRIRAFRSESAVDAPVIICMPAMGVFAKFYEPLTIEMAKKGWNAVTADLRGNGLSSVRVSKNITFGYHEMITIDWPAIIAKTRTIFPKSPLFLMGHSLGGQLNCLYCCLHTEAADGLILIAACSVYYKGWDFPYNLGILAGTQFIHIIACALGYFPGKRFGFGGTAAKGMIADWANNAFTGRYDVAGSPNNFEKMLAQLKMPVLAISFHGDKLAPKRAVENLYRKMPRASTTHRHLLPPEASAETLDHFSWVRHSKLVLLTIERWFTALDESFNRRTFLYQKRHV